MNGKGEQLQQISQGELESDLNCCVCVPSLEEWLPPEQSLPPLAHLGRPARERLSLRCALFHALQNLLPFLHMCCPFTKQVLEPCFNR